MSTKDAQLQFPIGMLLTLIPLVIPPLVILIPLVMHLPLVMLPSLSS